MNDFQSHRIPQGLQSGQKAVVIVQIFLPGFVQIKGLDPQMKFQLHSPRFRSVLRILRGLQHNPVIAHYPRGNGPYTIPLALKSHLPEQGGQLFRFFQKFHACVIPLLHQFQTTAPHLRACPLNAPELLHHFPPFRVQSQKFKFIGVRALPALQGLHHIRQSPDHRFPGVRRLLQVASQHALKSPVQQPLQFLLRRSLLSLQYILHLGQEGDHGRIIASQALPLPGGGVHISSQQRILLQNRLQSGTHGPTVTSIGEQEFLFLSPAPCTVLLQPRFTVQHIDIVHACHHLQQPEWLRTYGHIPLFAHALRAPFIIVECFIYIWFILFLP